MIAGVVLVGAAFVMRDPLLAMVRGEPATATVQPAAGNALDLSDVETTLIRAADGFDQVSASGNIELVAERTVVVEVGGLVDEVLVETGDKVIRNQPLLVLDSTDLARAVERAELSLASARASLEKLQLDADAAEIASAQASLRSAQENLLEVQAGAEETEIAAAEASLAAAWASYNDLLEDPGTDELTQLRADLETAEIDLRQAQAAYDKIAYADNLGESQQAASLQQATIVYEKTLAAYNLAVEPAGTAELQSAWSSIQNAQANLDDLQAKPTAAELASAEAQVTSALASLESLLADPDAPDLESAEISVAQAELDLLDAQEALALVHVPAPIDGTVLDVQVSAGQQVNAGATVLSLADMSQLELTIDVAEVDVSKLVLGQQAEISVDALTDETFGGLVRMIAPLASTDGGVVNYAVTIQLTQGALDKVRPGMTAVATVFTSDSDAVGWLVPTEAVRERGAETVVVVLRDGQPTPISVVKQGVQGEWTVVESADLQNGDEAVGAVASFINQDEQQQQFGPPPDGGLNRVSGGGLGGGNRP